MDLSSYWAWDPVGFCSLGLYLFVPGGFVLSLSVLFGCEQVLRSELLPFGLHSHGFEAVGAENMRHEGSRDSGSSNTTVWAWGPVGCCSLSLHPLGPGDFVLFLYATFCCEQIAPHLYGFKLSPLE